MLNRRNFLKAVGISPVVLVSVKAVGKVPESNGYNLNLGLSGPHSSEVRRRLRPMMRRAMIYRKNAHRFILHLNWQDSEELILDFKKLAWQRVDKDVELYENLTLYYTEIKWFCDTDVSFVATKAPFRGHRFPQYFTPTRILTKDECELFCKKMRRSSK